MSRFAHNLAGWIGAAILAQAAARGGQPARPGSPTPDAAIATNTAAPPAGTNTLATASAGYVIDDKHKLQPGDKISFRIIEDRELARILTVTDSGELDAPYIGLVATTGKSCRQLAQELKGLLEQEYYYHATVVIGLDSVTKVLGRVYIWGQVRNQGPVEIPTGETFTAGKAILRAGGFGEFAKKTAVKVIRTSAAGKQTFDLNMEDILEKGKTEKDVPLEPDDLILVPQRLINF